MNLSGSYTLVLGQIPCGVAYVTADLASKAVFSMKYVVDLQAQYHGILLFLATARSGARRGLS